MEHAILSTRHPDNDLDLLADYEALYAGGRRFRARIGRFLTPNDLELEGTYLKRCSEAAYRSYVGPIVDYFAAMLLSSALVTRATKDDKPVEADKWWAQFKEDCDGTGTDLDAFLRARVTEALQRQRAWWRIEMPSLPPALPEDRAAWDALKLGSAKLVEVAGSEVLDWAENTDGTLAFVVTYSVTSVRRSAAERRGALRHEWTIYDAEKVETYVFDQQPGQTIPDDIPLANTAPHGCQCVPFVCLDVGENFWVLNRLADAQKEHFRLSAGLGWAIRRTCYAMPVFSCAPGENGEYQPPKMGAGYYLTIGQNDKANYLSPPGETFAVIQTELKNQKDEIYRVVHQMALGVDNNAAAVGRSGQSKLADAEAIKIILTSLGSTTRVAVERTYDMVSAARGEDHDWSIEGLDTYDDTDPQALIDAIATAIPLDIPSPTFHREVKTRAAIALAGGADQATKDQIRKELKENITDESVLAKADPLGEGTDPEGASNDRPGSDGAANGRGVGNAGVGSKAASPARGTGAAS